MGLNEQPRNTAQIRTEIGGYDLKAEKLGQFTSTLSELGFREIPPLGANKGYATIYFLPRPPLGHRLRYRIYGLNRKRVDKFILQQDDIGVLELKGKRKLYPEREEYKYREVAKAATVAQIIKYPQIAREILSTTTISNLPSWYPRDAIPKSELRLFQDQLQGGSLFPSLIISSDRRHFVIDPTKPDSLRITLDVGTNYFGYPPDPSEVDLFKITEVLGIDARNRVEVKVGQPDYFEQGKAVVDILRNIGYLPLRRQKGFETYFRHFYGAPSNEALQLYNRISELPDYEVEAKLDIFSDKSIDEIIVWMYKLFKEKDQHFKLHQYPIEPIKESVTHATRYGYLKKGEPEEAFTIIENKAKREVGVKRKELVFNHNGILTNKEERIKLENWPELTNYAEEMIVQAELERTGLNSTDIFRIGTSQRRKKSIYIQNKTSGRGYIVSIDESITHKGSVLRQIEIEYGYRDGVPPVYGLAVLPAIEEDIEYIRNTIVGKGAENEALFVPTEVTKFKWLRSISS